MGACGHAEFLGLLGVKATLGARQLLTVVVLNALSPDMLLTVAGLAAQAGVLAMAITRLTLEGLLLQNLTGGLVLKLVILTQEVLAVVTPEDASPVAPHITLTLITNSIHEGTGAGVSLETLPPMTHPRLTEITDGAHHTQAGGEGTGMLHDTVTSLQHAFHLATLSTLRQPLQGLTEVAECSVFLPPLALVTFHYRVARQIRQGAIGPTLPQLLLSCLLLLSLLPLSCLLLGHVGGREDGVLTKGVSNGSGPGELYSF